MATQTRPSHPLAKATLTLAIAAFAIITTVFTGSVEPTRAEGFAMSVGVAVPKLPWEVTQLDSFESSTGKRNGIVNCFWSWDDANYTPDMSLFARIADRGSTPMITWMPQDYRLSINQPAFSLSAILSGNYDTFLTNWATAVASYKRPILLRFAHEMNGNWYPWSAGINGNTPAQYIAVWRKIHDIFVAKGATNVIWVWSPNVDNTDPAAFYPGDSYVDMVGLDGYNNLAWGTWRSFSDVFGPTYNHLASFTRKAVMIAEVGTSEGASPTDKANWIKSMYGTELPQKFPKVTAVLWFSVDMRALEANSADWRVDSSDLSLKAYRDAITQYTSNGVLLWTDATVAIKPGASPGSDVATSGAKNVDAKVTQPSVVNPATLPSLSALESPKTAAPPARAPTAVPVAAATSPARAVTQAPPMVLAPPRPPLVLQPPIPYVIAPMPLFVRQAPPMPILPKSNAPLVREPDCGSGACQGPKAVTTVVPSGPVIAPAPAAPIVAIRPPGTGDAGLRW